MRLLAAFVFLAAACGPTDDRSCTLTEEQLAIDPNNCGACDNACGDGFTCVASQCVPGECAAGTVEDCYTAPGGTLGVGPCRAGTRTCDETGTFSACSDVIPVQEICTDGIDNDCNGATDDDVDADGDGVTGCGGDCADNQGIVDRPELVNPGAFDAPGNNFDDDCDGMVDNTVLLCDQDIASNTQDAMEYARAIDICQTTTDDGVRWGVIDGRLSHVNGTGTPDPEGHAIRPMFGSGALPQGGVNLAILSTGGAAAPGDTNPGFHPFTAGAPTFGFAHIPPNTSEFPADFFAANMNKLPNAPGCPAPNGSQANDPQMLTMRVKVPTNAKSFRLSINFFTSEFPEWTCTPFNDFLVVLLDSTYADNPPNPPDKNLAFYQQPLTNRRIPVGANLAHGNTGLFTQCRNGRTGCEGNNTGTITTCTGRDQLAATGFDDPAPGVCDAGSLSGGATGWLQTAGNVVGGEIITLRIGIWDTSDHGFDSLALVDGFQWSTEVAQPGTVVLSAP